MVSLNRYGQRKASVPFTDTGVILPIRSVASPISSVSAKKAFPECLQWLFFQASHIGPMFGQFEHFHRRGDDNAKDLYALERYEAESRRLMGILDNRLSIFDYMMGPHYSIADIATFPWVRSLGRLIDDDGLRADFPDAMRWFDSCMARPASEIALTVCADYER